MKRILVATTLAVATAWAGNANAAIEAVSFLNVTNFRLHDGGGAPITQGSQVVVSGTTFTSSVSADISSIGGSAGGSITGPAPIFLDSTIAFQGAGGAPGDDSLFPLTNHGGLAPHALSDTYGEGSIIAGLGPNFGANSFTTSQVDLATGLGSTDSGSANTTSTSTASFIVRTASAGMTVVGSFEATLSLLAQLIPTPPGSTAQASSSFSMRVTGPGVQFDWVPGLFISGGTEISAPFSLNATRTAPQGGTDSFFDDTTGDARFFSASLVLPFANQSYSFSISQTTTVAASTVGVVPEPSTMAIWGVLATCVGGISYRRRVCS